MRSFLVALMLIFVSPALAQEWGHYANARFGYAIDVPPGLTGNGESDNGDGQMFYSIEAEQGLTVWGGYLMDSFEAEVAAAQTSATAENWMLARQSSTPQWAEFYGQRDHRIFYERFIPLCDGASFAAARLEFNIRDLGEMDGVIEGLKRSFVAEGC